VQGVPWSFSNGRRGGRMNLNLQILQTDLQDIVVSANIIDPRLDRKLAFPVIYNSETRPLGDRLYLSYSADLPAAINLDERPSFLFIGSPPAQYMANECNVLIVKKGLSIYALLARVSELFQHYNSWELELQKANIESLPLINLGVLAEPVFENPISLHSESIRYLFHVVNPKRYFMPDNYAIFKENDYWELEDVNLLKYDNEFNTALMKKEPAIYPSENYGFRSLYMNIFFSGRYVARLLIDEINRQFTDRDFALITVLGDAVKDGLRMKAALDQWYPRRLDEIVAAILNSHSVDEKEIKTVLAENGWAVSDRYFCLTIVPSELDIRGKTLFALANNLSAMMPGNCCLVHNNTIVCLFNLSATKTDRKILQGRLLPKLRDSFLKAGMSAVFSDFMNLHSYYQQTLIALRLGEKRRKDCWYYDFKDHALDYIIENGKGELITASLCPEGLLRLRQHDREQGTDYEHVLRVYLENSMNAALTQRKLYMHRNTFYYKLNHLKEILDMNLEDFSVRLYLMIAFRLMDEA
jgi:hypothetical protein